MKKKLYLIIPSLLISLFIYVFYRTEKTVVNELLFALISEEKFNSIRNYVVTVLPMHEHIIYALPGGLWVFYSTLISKYLLIKIGNSTIFLVFAPLLFSLGLELFQAIHVINGRFDYWDVGAYILFWTIANYLVPFTSKKQNIIKPFNYNSLLCVLSYLIVFLAHVWQ